MRRLCVLVLLVSVLVCPADLSPVIGPEPIRCAPCSPEQLDSCPAVSSDCPEVLREPGCGCCSSCALKKGESCGVYTAHCGAGLRCVPRPGDPRPLHALTRGHAVCTEDDRTEDEPDVTSDQGSLHYLLGLNRPLDPRDAAEAQESIKAKVNAIRKKLIQLGPCHTELHAALDLIAESQQTLGDKFTSFYLPNCDKHGFYKAQQCETSLEAQPPRCWCVSSWNGNRIRVDLASDSQCPQELTH
ncbi:insulin-like growth factor-binding protein 1b [Sinocyclocheilus rhinocerous]|uniref:Insulin-like growth factor-binding protein 1 n=1 Tax=Sinocyclocheilus rhinocerous TaxID=307959 RepID=A0A673JMH9_9TELE|nr:PREDICTED: insulin-like growth factor-binding protein 1 [Sinocyclocheilus rhinocerous]